MHNEAYTPPFHIANMSKESISFEFDGPHLIIIILMLNELKLVCCTKLFHTFDKLRLHEYV